MFWPDTITATRWPRIVLRSRISAAKAAAPAPSASVCVSV
jgi:hypothetical protein